MAFLSTPKWFPLWILMLFFPAGVGALPNVVLYEQEVKVGMLYNFLKYTKWPADIQAASETIVCIFGDSALNAHLNTLKGRTVNQKPIAVRHIKSINETQPCHLLLVSSSTKEHWKQLEEYLKNRSILTVSDIENFAHNGGMIGFNTTDNRIQVELNLETVNAAQLGIEDRLLKLVKVVHSPPQGEP